MPQFQPVQFGKYFLLDRIATGGMAEVFKAKITGEHGFEKIIIIKTLFPHLQSEKDLVRSFIEEAKLAALLQHQNIVQIYDFGRVDESYFIAMEYLPGINLRRILDLWDQCPLNLENTLFITQKICAGLNYAHTKKDAGNNPLQIIHRDVSPPNIILTDEGQLKIIDFGIARAASQNTSTQMGIIKGKVAYMSPEQAEGIHIDHRSDIFSIGIILYEMATGRQMYKGDTVEVLSMAQNAQFIPVEALRPDLPEPVREIIQKALQKDKVERYQSADEMMNDIETCISKLDFRPADHKLALMVDQIRKTDAALKQKPAPGKKSNQDLSIQNDSKTKIEFQETIETDISRPSGSGKKIAIYSALLIILLILGLTLGLMKTRETVIPPPKTRPDVMDVLPAVPVAPEPRKKITREEETLAIQALEQKRFNDAVMLFEKLLEVNPAMGDKLNPFYMEALLGAASEFLEQDTDLAEDIILKALAVDPENLEGYFQLGQIHVKRKDYVNAEKTYQKIIELDDHFVDAFFNLGYIYAVNKDFKNAEIMYQKAVDLAPPYLDEALFNLSVVQDKLGKKETVAINLIKALKINPGNKMVEKYLEKFNRENGGN